MWGGEWGHRGDQEKSRAQLLREALGCVPTDLDLMGRETPEATQMYSPTCWAFLCLSGHGVSTASREDGSA